MLKLRVGKLIRLQNQKERHQSQNFQLLSLKIQIEIHKLYFLTTKLKISNF